MTIAIHQPNFFPWAGYFRKIKESDIFVFLDTVDITLGSSKSITHRTKIKTPNGENYLTVPLRKRESKLIKDILIDNAQPWKKKMLTNIQHNYSKANCYEETMNWFEPFLNQEHEFLSAMNISLLKKICALLKIKTDLKTASELKIEHDDRNLRLIEICKSLGGTIYLSGKGGAGYNAENIFAENKIDIRYIQYPEFNYPQLHGDFLAGLSLLDMLFNIGIDSQKFYN